MTCWVVSDGKAGMENQCLGLAEALGLHPVVKRIRLRAPWRQLVPFLRYGLQCSFSPLGDTVAPPWPDLLIGTGRQSVAASLYVRRVSGKDGGKPTVTVQIQNPVLAPSHFDLVVVPSHDNLSGPNVITTRGSMHRISKDKLEREGAVLSGRIRHLPSPYIGVLIGGNSKVYTLGPREMRAIADQLISLAKTEKGSLIITPSRRTGTETMNVLRSAFHEVPHFLWEGEGDNPYFGILALADALLVTADSVNMVSEACSTGKPVHIIELPGGSEKFERFHKSMRDDGMTRVFCGRLETWSYPPLDEMSLVAGRIRDFMERAALSSSRP